MSSDEPRQAQAADLEHLRAELHEALHRARVHLEWTEIMLLLAVYRTHERDREHASEVGAFDGEHDLPMNNGRLADESD